jgi:hypothetical protein
VEQPLHPAGQPVGPNYPSQPPIYQPGYPQQPGYPPPPTGPSQPIYGAAQSAYPPPPMQSMQPMAYGAQHPARTGQGDSMAVAGMILGVISLAVFMVGPCGFIFSVLGIIFSIAGSQSVHNQKWATAGLVLSSVGLAVTVLHGLGLTIPGLP